MPIAAAAAPAGHDRGRPVDGRSRRRRRRRPRLLGAVGVTYVDGPVSGGAAGARAGTIALMFAGPAAVLERPPPDVRGDRRQHLPRRRPRRAGAGHEAAQQLPVGHGAGGDVGGAGVRPGPRPRPGDDGRRRQRLIGPQHGDVGQVPQPGAHRDVRRRLPHRADGEGSAPVRRHGGPGGDAGDGGADGVGRVAGGGRARCRAATSPRSGSTWPGPGSGLRLACRLGGGGLGRPPVPVPRSRHARHEA